MPKIVQYNLPPGGTVTQVADSVSSALLVEGVDDADYLQIDTTNSAEKVIIAGGGAKVGVGDTAPASMLGVKGNLVTQGAGTIESISTATVTGSGSAFLTKFSPGSAIKFTNDAGGTEIHTVLSVANNTELVLTETPGATGAGRGTKTYFHDPDLFQIKTGDEKARLKFDSLGQLTVCDTATTNVMVTDGDIVTMTGTNNTIIGSEPLAAMTTSNNTRLGQRAGRGSTGSSTTMIGAQSGEGASAGAEVTLYGFHAGNAGPGSYSTAIGPRALAANQSGGTSNTGVGHRAGETLTTGDQCVFIGDTADGTATDGNQIAIGYDANTDAANQVRLGNTSIDDIDGQVALTATSDSRIKTNVEDLAAGLEFINALRPVSFSRVHPADWPEEIRDKRYKEGQTVVDSDGNESIVSTSSFDVETQQPIKDTFDDVKRSDGLLAQEVQAACASLGVTFNGIKESANGKLGIQYSLLVAPLIKAVQELTARIEELENGD